MKISSLFVELGFKVEGSDLDTLRSFETTLNNIANAADRAVASLRQLQGIRIRIPAPTTQTAAQPATPAVSGATAAPSVATATPPLLPRPLPGTLSFIGPVRPTQPTAPATSSFGSEIFAGLAKGSPLFKTLAQLGTLGGVAMVLSKALTLAIHGIIRLGKASLDASVNTEKAMATTGLSRKELKGFESFAVQSGISSDTLVEAAKGFQTAAQDIRYGGGDPAAFGFVGVNPFQSTANILSDFVKQTKDLTVEEARYRAQRIGINDELFYALRKYGSDLLKTIPESLLLTQQQQNDTAEAAKALRELGLSTRMLVDVFTAELAPAIKFIAKSLQIVADARVSAGAMISPVTTGSMLPLFASLAAKLSSPKLPAFVQTASGTNTTNVNVVNNIDGAKSPVSLADAITNALKRTMSDTYNQSPAYPGVNY